MILWTSELFAQAAQWPNTPHSIIMWAAPLGLCLAPTSSLSSFHPQPAHSRSYSTQQYRPHYKQVFFIIAGVQGKWFLELWNKQKQQQQKNKQQQKPHNPLYI